MKRCIEITVAVFLICVSPPLGSQARGECITPIFDWGGTMGGTGVEANGNDFGGCAFDASGNLLYASWTGSASGGADGTIDYDPTSGIDIRPNKSMFLTKINADGTYGWTYRGASKAWLFDLAVDNAGNTFLTGHVEVPGFPNFDPDGGDYVVPFSGITDIFLTKVAPNGIHMWTQPMGAGSADSGRAVAIDSEDGSAYVAGHFGPPFGFIDFDFSCSGDCEDREANSHGGSDAFVVKRSSDGEFLWRRTWGGPRDDFIGDGRTMAVDSNGAVLVTGRFEGINNPVDFDPTDGVDVRSGNIAESMFVVKLLSDGSYGGAWVFDGGLTPQATSVVRSSGLAVDASNNVFLTGYFEGPVDFDPTSAEDVRGPGAAGLFLTRINGDGSYGWTRTVLGSDITGTAVAVGSDNRVVVTGYFSGSGIDFNPTGGGDLHSSKTFGSTGFYMRDTFLMVIHPDGTYDWTRTLGGEHLDQPFGLAIGPNEEIAVSGNFVIGMQFDPLDRAGVHASNGDYDLFAVKYNCRPDIDDDGVLNEIDNCISTGNPDQADGDGDGVGNACDNCPNGSNADQANTDSDSLGNICDPCPVDPDNDLDGDGLCGNVDACPNDPNNDVDGDGICGDVDHCPLDPTNHDPDADGSCGNADNCPNVHNSGQEDGDGDGIGDSCDPCVNSATPDRLYWSVFTDGVIKRADTNDTGCTESAINSPQAWGIAVDPNAGKVYWTDVSTNSIRRASLTGQSVQTLVTNAQSPRGIAVDPVHGKIYWVQDGDNVLRRANSDGSGMPETLVATGIGTPRGVAVDPVAGKVYWSDHAGSPADSIKRANLDGTGVEVVLSSTLDVLNTNYLALDSSGSKIYWVTQSPAPAVRRVNVNGSGTVETLVTAAAGGLTNPQGIALDIPENLMYWTDTGNGGAIKRATLTGANITIFVLDQAGINGLALFKAPVGFVPGDCDGNGILSVADVSCFANALVDVDTSPPGGITRSDMNGDQLANGLDISLFVQALMP